MARKVYDDAAGAHVTKPPTLASVDEIYEPAPHVAAALEVTCPTCNAKPGVRCGGIIDASKYLEPPHAARIEAARARATEDR